MITIRAETLIKKMLLYVVMNLKISGNDMAEKERLKFAFENLEPQLV